MEISLLELGWRVGLYTKRKYREHVTLNGLSRAETVKASHLLMEFWPSIRDGGFNVGNTKVESIKDPKVKLAHRCIATTISGRKESTNRVTKIDLYYLYCIYTEGVVYNIPYWLEKYLRTVKEDDEAEEEAGGEAANEGAGDMENEVDISALTMKQYIALIPNDIKPGIVNPKIGDDVKFEINENFMRELRRKLFAGTDGEDAYEHVRTVLEIVDPFHFPSVTHDAIMLRVFVITGNISRVKYYNIL
ncbi:hypothetical protein Tco_0186267 [Tanacetum coccineum]